MRGTATNTLMVVMSLLWLPGCGQQDAGQDSTQPEAAAPVAAPTVYESMVQTVVPHSNRIWELAGNLYDDDGNIDPQKLTAAQWQEIQEGAAAMGASARALAQAGSITAAPAGTKIQNEGTAPGAPGAAAVQVAIDADPQGFRAEAMKLATLADEIAAAAAARDGVKTDDASGRLAEPCSTCHAKYWYPDQTG